MVFASSVNDLISYPIVLDIRLCSHYDNLRGSTTIASIMTNDSPVIPAIFVQSISIELFAGQIHFSCVCLSWMQIIPRDIPRPVYNHKIQVLKRMSRFSNLHPII